MLLKCCNERSNCRTLVMLLGIACSDSSSSLNDDGKRPSKLFDSPELVVQQNTSVPFDIISWH